MMSRACSEVLLGKSRVYNDDSFVALWKECIATFDELYQDDTDEGDEVAASSRQSANGGRRPSARRRNGRLSSSDLLKTVSVCSNGYIICKKIEVLLRQVLSADAEEVMCDDSAVDTDARHGENSSAQTDFSDRLRAEPISERPKSNRRQSAQYVDAPPDAVCWKYLNTNPVPLPQESTRAISASGSRPQSRSTSASSTRPHSSASIANPSIQRNETTSCQTLPADKSREVTLEDLPIHGQLVDVCENDTPVNESEEPVESLAAGTSLNSISFDGRSNRNRSIAASSSSKKLKAGPDKGLPCRGKLSDYYPQFNMIFPVVFQHMQANRDDGANARELIECMQIQAKVYEEWVEVMRDYSTVFCMHSNFPAEHSNVANGSNALSENRSDLQRSADVYKGGTRALHYRVKSQRPEVTNIVSDVFSQFLPDWEALPSGLGLGLSWNLLWTWSKPRINKSHLLCWQRVNHFEHSRELTRKDLLKKNIQRYVDLSNVKSANSGATGGNGNGGVSDFEIMPPTFVLPHEYTQFVASFTASEQQKRDAVANGSDEVIHNYWILKPVGLSRGRGISLVRDLSDLSYSQSSVIQKYIERPLCLAAYKFDLRIYVVVTSFKPLEAFVYKDGFARVSTQKYSLNPNDVNNKFIHLTNSSIQKHNQQDIRADNPLHDTAGSNEDIGGSKISLLGNNGLWKLLERYQKVDCDLLWRNICLLIVKSLVMVDDKMTNQPCCFELFGYDILIDAQLRPWLIEVNASPSLARENALDVRVKNSMLKEMIDLLGVTPFDRAALARVIQRRLSNIGKNRYSGGRNDPDLEQDLLDILGPDYEHRHYGELPTKLGNYERLCPETSFHQAVLKMKKRIIKSD